MAVSLNAMARACRALGREQLPPTAIVGLLSLSLHPSSVEHVAIIVLAGDIAAHGACPDTWQRDTL